MAKPSGLKRPCPPSRNGAGAAARGWNQPPQPQPPMASVTMPVPADEYNHRADGEHPEAEEAVEELEIENDDDITEGAAALFGEHPIDVDSGDGDGGVDTSQSQDTNGASSGKLTAACWEDFVPIFDESGKIRTHAICKRCGKKFVARANIGTGSLNRHMATCRKKQDNDRRVQSRLSMNANGLHNWVYDAARARNELCRLIARLDLPLGVGDTQAWEDYIQNAHNPAFQKVSRQTTTRDMHKLFAEERALLMHSLLPACSSVSITSDIWSGNAKEDYVSVVAHYVGADWELHKKVIGFRLIEAAHTGDNIAEKICSVVEEFGLIDKVFAVSLDNASANSKAFDILQPMLFGYLGSYPTPTKEDPHKVKYLLVHQRCACHIINLIVKSGLKRFSPYLEAFRTAINFLNSSNQRIALFKNYCIARGVRPRKFRLDMDVRWNSTYLMLKHLLPYRDVFSVWIESNYGEQLLTPQHWYAADQIMKFLEMFYDATVALSGVYYPTAPLMMHHILDFAEHLHKAELDPGFRSIASPMKLKFLKYWGDIPLLYSYAFILDPRAKMKGFFNVLELLAKQTGTPYGVYYGDVKESMTRLFSKYEQRYGAARSQRPPMPSAPSGKRKQAWGKIYGGPGASSSSCSPTSSSTSGVNELIAYLDSDPVTDWGESFDILLWWRDHKLTYPILSIMARDIMSVPVSTVSSESCFSCTARILEDRRRRLLPEHVEMLTCIKDWDQAARKEQHAPEDTALEELFDNLYLDEGEGSESGSGSGSGSGGTAGAGAG